MNKNLWIILSILLLGGVITINIMSFQQMNQTQERTKIVLYDGPSGIEEAKEYVVTVNDQPLFLYDTEVNFNRSWTPNPDLGTTPMGYFDFEGKVEVKMKMADVKVESVTIRPLSLGIKPKIKDDTITFELTEPVQLVVEVNDKVTNALHLFANPIEKDPVNPEDPNVIYLGPGVHKADSIPVKSGQIVYIAGGAVVYGVIQGSQLENVTVRGRGILDGSIYDRWTQTMIPINFRHSKNMTVKDIIFLNPSGWTVNMYHSEDVLIDGIKIISCRSNSDGITLQSCKNITAKNSFLRSWDDSLVVKNYDHGNTKGITFENIIIWTDLAQSLEIGYETNGPVIEDITFKNITVLHNFHKPIISIHNSDYAIVKNIHYKDIVVEDASMGRGDAKNDGYLIDFHIGASQWSTSDERGIIENVTVENVTVLGGTKFPTSRIKGFDMDHTINNVRITGLKILGEDIRDKKSAKIRTNDYISNLVIE